MWRKLGASSSDGPCGRVRAVKRVLVILLTAVLLALIGRVLYRAIAHVEKHRETVVPVLMYHRIGDGGDSAWWVPTAVFEQQMRFIAESGYTSVLPSDLLAKRRKGRRLPDKPIVITFDDGSLNCLTDAEPILRRHGLRAVNFLITDYIADRPEERRRYEDADCLVWPEVREMQARGTVVFGGHSKSHANLRALGRRAGTEINACWDALVANGVQRPEGFCFPYGEYREETLEALRASPFKIGFTVQDRLARVGGTNSLLAVPRISVFGGARDLSVLSARRDEAAGELRVAVGFRGRPKGLPGAARLYGEGWAEDAGWLAPRRFVPGTNELAWPVAALPVQRGPLTLEIWDDHRVLRHYRAVVSPDG